MPENKILLSIIIVSYNTCELTLQAVHSCRKQIKNTKKLQEKTEIFVVDNNSTDETISQLKKIKADKTKLKIIQNKDNKGFAAANNQAIEQSKGEYILLLNSDTELKPKALLNLLNSFAQYQGQESTAQLSSHEGKLDKPGIIAATLLNKDGSIQPQGGSFPNLFNLAIHMWFLDDLPTIGKLLPSTQHTGKRFNLKKILKHQEPYQQDWVGGTAMMIKRKMLEEIGDLDSNIFMYGEDVEYCLRAKKHHWDVAIDPQAQVTHFGSASSSSKNALLGEIKGYLYIWAKHKPAWQTPFLKFILLTGCWLRIIIFSFFPSHKEKVSIYKKALTLIS